MAAFSEIASFSSFREIIVFDYCYYFLITVIIFQLLQLILIVAIIPLLAVDFNIC